MTTHAKIPIACDLTAIPPDARQQHVAEGLRVFQQAEAVHELADGFAFRFPANMFPSVAQLVEYERRCCPFFAFTLELAPGGGPLWLHIKGDDEVKAFTRAMFADAAMGVATGRIDTGQDDALTETIVQSAPGMAAVIARATPGKP